MSGQISKGSLNVCSAEGGGSFGIDNLNCPLNCCGGKVEVWNLNGAANVTWTSANDSISLKNFGTGSAVTFAENKKF